MKRDLYSLLPPRLYLELKRLDFRLSDREEFAWLQARRRIDTDDGYSYKPFDDKRAIFVHIPKCAGVSVSRTLFGNLGGGHTTLNQYLNVFEPRRIVEYFKFTFVRNPWDRLVSAYFFLKHGGFGEKDAQWFQRELSGFGDFDQFVRQWLNEENIWKWHHFRPQYHYMRESRGKVTLDFVGLFENIDADFEVISQAIGVDRCLPHANQSAHGSYMDHYTDETRAIVARVYREDIESLGYSFDNSSLPRQLARRRSNGALG